MKKYFSIAVLCALAVLGLGSCAKDVEEEIVTEQTGVRTVTFSASLADQTKTGLSMKFVPNWINTSLENVHLFETSGSTILEGVDVEMRVPEDRNNEVAYFKADFAEEISIIVNPPSPTGVKTRAADEYTYTGIVAQKVDGKFTIPATQYPDAVSLIDPNADFLIGDTKTSFSESMALKEMDIYFVRPVSVSRLAIMNIEGQKVKTVKITSTDKLTASAAYSDVNFSASTVSWDNSGSNVITISYGEAGKDIPAEATFYAYFLSLPGNKNITSVEVTTDQYVYTKSYASGKTLKFDTVEFRNIAVDMSKVTPTPVGPVAPVDQDIYFFKNNGQVTEDSYDLYPGTTAYVTPELRGAATGATVTYSIACTPAGAASITPAAVVTPVAAGTPVITGTASAVTGYKETEISYTLTITDSTPDAVDQDLSFVKGGETVETDSFDLYPAGGTYTAPTLTGAAEGATVTYAIECTPEGVATIDASTGAVTPAAVGTAVITATASAVAPLYKQTSKSYTLTVTDSTPAPVEETTYTLVTNTLKPGTYILISDDSSSSYNNRYTVALFPTVVTTSWEGTSPVQNGQRFNEKDVTLSGNSIVTDDAEIVGAEVELEASGSGWKIKAKKTGEYLVAPTQSYRIPLSTNAADAAVFTISTAQNRSITAGGYYFFHSGSANGFTIRNTGSTVSNVRFYQKAKKTQTLAFAGTSAEYDLKDGGSWTISVPELVASGAETTISYASSNTAVAEVNTNSGVITIPSTAKKGDSAVITATAEETEEFAEATATYTISIVDSTPGVMVTYKKVTSTSGLRAGAKYLLVFEGLAGDTDGDGNPKVFSAVLNSDGTQFYKHTSAALDVTIASGVIESSDFGDCQFTLEAASSGYYLKGDTANKYIYPGSSGSSSVMLAESTASHALTISFTSAGIAEIMYRSGNTSRYLVWSTSSHYFSCNTAVSGQYSTGICLYRMDDGTPDPVAQTIAFTPAAAQYDLYTQEWTPSQPVLGGAQTDVNYESSDATVASVAADGTITPLKVGEVTITANAEASSAYLAATATCTVTVVDSTPVTPGEGKVYKKVTSQSELVADGAYLIVYENGADSKVFKPIRNGSSFTTSTANAEAVTITNNTITSSELDDHTVVFRNADGNTKFAMWVPGAECYMILRRSYTSFVADETDNGYRSTFTVTDGSVTIVRDNYYLRYSSSNSYFQVSNTSSNSTVALYKLDAGTTPDDPEPPTPETPTYTKVDAITSGATYLIVATDANNYNGNGQKRAFTGDASGNVVEVDGTSGTITGDYSACEFVITAEGEDYSLNGPNGYVTGQSTSDPYIQVSATKGTMALTDAATLKAADNRDGLVSDAFYFYYLKGTSTEVLYLNSNGRFKIGGSGRKYGVYLYKKN